MDKKYTKEEIYNTICNILSDEYEIKKEKLNPNSDLFNDLELDSIDAVDLAVRLQQYTDKRISPEEFKKIRTLNDVTEALYKLIHD